MNNDLMERIQSQISQLTSALGQLDAALEYEPTEINKDGTIQRFEFTYELSWHLLQKCLNFQGREAASPRQVFRIAGETGLITDVAQWISFLEARNLTTHSYDREVADEVYGQIRDFAQATHVILDTVRQIVGDGSL